MNTLFNFNAGPAMLPPTVLEQVQAELRDYHGSGMSIMEMSHRAKDYEAVNAQAEASFKRLLGVGDGYRVVFLQGGASTQFAMVPMNFLSPGAAADFLLTGAWAEKAHEEAAALGPARVAASTRADAYRRVPTRGSLAEERAPVQYMIATCLRKLGKRDEAAKVYREVVGIKDDPFIADCARWQLQTLTWRKDVDTQLAALRQRRKGLQDKP